jgi:beta-glucanase (GH16 family)
MWEIDILEYVGENQILFLLYTHRTVMEIQSTQKTRIEDIEEGYHIYAMDWSKDKIDFFVDNNLVYTFNPENKTEAIWPIINPSFIVNLAIGGSFEDRMLTTRSFHKIFL